MVEGTRIVGGRYSLGEHIAAGGMGVVWRGEDLRLGRVVAIKELLLRGGLDETATSEAKRRAIREARIAARLHHPNAVTIFDVVEDSGQPWLVMEYVPSQNLTAVLAERGPLPPVEVAAIGRQLASALAAAHDAGIVHRDIKPGNVLVTRNGTVKITDFGISRAVGDATITAASIISGTPAYLAPEVARGADASHPSDVFSLGATLYSAVEGTPPFGTDENLIALLYRVAGGVLRPPLQAGILAPLLLEMLHREPAARPTMAQTGTRLAALVAAHQPPAPKARRAPAVLPPPAGAAARRQSPPPDARPIQLPPTSVLPAAPSPEPAPPPTTPPAGPGQEPAPAPPGVASDREPARPSTLVTPGPESQSPLAPPTSAPSAGPATPTAPGPEPVTPPTTAASGQESAPPLTPVTSGPSAGPVTPATPSPGLTPAVPGLESAAPVAAGSGLATPDSASPAGAASVPAVSTTSDGTVPPEPADAPPTTVNPSPTTALREPSGQSRSHAATGPGTADDAVRAADEPKDPTGTPGPTARPTPARATGPSKAAATARPVDAGVPGKDTPGSGSRRNWVLGGTGLVLVIVVGIAALLANHDDSPSGTGAQPTFVSTASPGARPTPQSATPARTSAPSTPSPEAVVVTPQRAVADYYALLLNDPRAGYALLSDRFKQDRAPSFGDYQEFWGQMRSVTATEVAAAGEASVSATITYTSKAGQTSQEHHVYGLVKVNGQWLIDSQRIV
ncbi:protein kinase [Longispora sp. K20-0274]|uniref:serine/threonine-protein kinase n=1 Tax=Longispora sp. K20-0274 TaxID=3088255 RepID=UPI00399BD5FF